MKKIAFLTGTNGQDGSYLIELLLKKDYIVHGIIRRSSVFNTERIDFLMSDEEIYNKKLFIHYGDVTDSGNINQLISEIKPDEVFNLAAQSHVKVSFEIPYYTATVDALGTLNILEAVRTHCPHARVLQASTSELFGGMGFNMPATGYTEESQFYPRSPYGCAKLYGYWIVKNYNEAYGTYACNAISFNHESICKNSPVIIMENNKIDILPIEDLFRTDKHKYEGLLDKYMGCLIWSGSNWTTIKNGSCYQDKDKATKIIQTRESCCEATLDHCVFLENDNNIPIKEIKKGDKLYKTKFPEQINTFDNDPSLAKFLGFLCGDGCVSDEGHIRLTGNDKKQLEYYASLVVSKFGWSTHIAGYKSGFNSAGFDSKKIVYQLNINNDTNWGKWIRSNIYTLRDKEKRVPQFILNSNPCIKKAFFDGYYDADGRKAGRERYAIKGFTTSSATLCLGLLYIFKSFSSQSIKCKCEYRNSKRYYYVQFGSPSPNKNGLKIKNEVIKTTEAKSDDGWFFDIQTENETFATGPNLCKIHNSPRRGDTFVTKKITNWFKKIAKCQESTLYLGNINAHRDWGHAKDVVEAMWLMLQQDKPEDFVIATNETHTVKQFIEECCRQTQHELQWMGEGVNEVGTVTKEGNKHYIKISEKYFRPSEVEYLLGDATKARTKLGWVPKYTFSSLVADMLSDGENDGK
jgi:GDPmannose 4,6-dehydratase